MKFLHTADIHVGASRKLDGYLQRQEQMLRGIYRIAEKHTDKVVILAGDIFHRKDVKPKERDMLLDLLVKYDSEGFTTLIINGNHDILKSDYSSIHFLKILQESGRLKNTIIQEVTSSSVHIKNTNFILIPWHAYSTEEFNALVSQHIDEITNADPIYVVAHECIFGASSDTWSADSSYLKIIEDSRVTAYCLGDIHKPQKIGSKIWYSGSPIQHDFGDENNKHVLIFDTECSEPYEVCLTGIRPLLTFDELPEDKIDAYIRVVGDVENNDLIANENDIVYLKPKYEPVKVNLSDALLEDLVPCLAERGLNAEHQIMGLNMAQDMLRSVGND